MAQQQPNVTFSNLLTQPDITKMTIQLYLQILIGQGYYTVGGIAANLKSFASAQGISANAQFLFSQIASEVATLDTGGASLPQQGGFTYKYIPASDLLQIFLNGTELTASEPIPQGVYEDTITGVFTWNRL